MKRMQLFFNLIIVAIVAYFLGYYPIHVNAWVASGTPLSYSTFVTGINYATQIAIDSSGYVYQSGWQACCTIGNKGIAKFNSAGVFQLKFGAVGSTGVAVDPDGNIISVDYQSDNIEKFTNTGTPISITGTDLENQVYSSPYAAAVDSLGNIYIANAGTNEIFKFNSSLAKIATITGYSGAFNFPETVAVDPNNNLYVNDSGNNRIQKFNSSGVWQLTVTGNGSAFNYPEALTVDINGNIYVGDSGNNRIQIFDTNGVFQQEITSANVNTGTGSPITYLSGMGFLNPDTLYVGDSTRSFKIVFDHNDPAVTVDALPSDSTSDTTPTLTGIASDTITAITNVEYSVDSGAWTACTSDDGLFDELSETYSCTVSPALTAGSHSIDVRATDSKGNTNSGATIVIYPFDIVVAVADSGSSSSSSNNSGTSNSSGGSVCVPLSLGVSPNIFSIVRTGTKANIYFSPISSDAAGYQLMYGHAPGDERFGTTFKTSSSTGAQQYVVDGLEANRKYYFWMRGVSDCSEPGPWSTIYESFKLDNYYSDTDELFENSDLDSTATDSGQSNNDVSLSEMSDSPNSSDGIGGNGITGSDGKTANEQGLTDIKNTFAYLFGEPLAEELSRQILMPVDASYAVKVGAVGVAANIVVASAITFLTLSKTIFSSLSVAYKASSRSILKMPSDYLSSLMKYSFMGFTSGLSPLLPFLSRKKNRNGVVFDALSFKPLAKVYVILFSKSGNLKTDFSDQLGKYEFQDLALDDYQMRAEIVGYNFPSKIITTSLSEVGDIYFPGNVISIIDKKSEVPELALPMDPSKIRNILLIYGHKISGLFRILNPIVILISSVVIFVAVYSNPSQFNQIVSIIFILYLLGKVFLTKKVSKENGLINNKTGRPISNNSRLNQGATLSI